MQCETTQLMTAVKQGDESAFDLLVERTRGQAFQVARSLVGSRDDALDLSQETFMKVFKARMSYREGEPFLPWFHRILRNTCFSHLRKQRRLRKTSLSVRNADEDGEEWDVVDEDAPSPSSRLERTDNASSFWEAFKSLDTKDREIVALRHFKELSYKEIAETLDIPQGTVMSRLFHARRKLRELLVDTLGDAGLDALPEGMSVQSTEKSKVGSNAPAARR